MQEPAGQYNESVVLSSIVTMIYRPAKMSTQHVHEYTFLMALFEVQQKTNAL